MAIKNVVLSGAGGNLGPSILTQLLKAKEFHVSVLSRASSSATFPAEVTVLKADYGSLESLTTALKGQDAVISTIGGMGLDAQELLIDACVAAGVQRLIPSEFGSDTDNAKAVEWVKPMFTIKAELIKYVKGKEKDGLSWTGIATGPFFDWGLRIGFLGLDLEKKTATLYDGGDNEVAMTVLSDIGRACVGVLRKPDETKNKMLYVGSVSITQNQLLASVEKITGDKYTSETVSALKSREEGASQLAQGNVFGMYDLLKGVIFGGPDFTNDFKKFHGLSNDLLGVPNRNVDDAVTAALKNDNLD
ncbi:MAG: hypothetical protein M1814_000673 [Vezdaea aestivalis]|nr:MAG: hypothetical protein M1814_000673 [Vezdaea aestivalis]